MIDNYETIFFLAKIKNTKLVIFLSKYFWPWERFTVRFKVSDCKMLPMKSNATLKMTLRLGSMSVCLDQFCDRTRPQLWPVQMKWNPPLNWLEDSIGMKTRNDVNYERLGSMSGLYVLCALTINPSIYNILRWVAGTMGQMNRRPSVWCSKYWFFLDFL